jgi:hypothetical protein
MSQFKRIPADQHDRICDLLEWFMEKGKVPAIPGDQTPQGLKPFNLLLRRGFVVRYEFDDRRFGYEITRSGQDYCLAMEPDIYSLAQEATK